MKAKPQQECASAARRGRPPHTPEMRMRAFKDRIKALYRLARPDVALLAEESAQGGNCFEWPGGRTRRDCVPIVQAMNLRGESVTGHPMRFLIAYAAGEWPLRIRNRCRGGVWCMNPGCWSATFKSADTGGVCTCKFTPGPDAWPENVVTLGYSPMEEGE